MLRTGDLDRLASRPPPQRPLTAQARSCVSQHHTAAMRRTCPVKLVAVIARGVRGSRPRASEVAAHGAAGSVSRTRQQRSTTARLITQARNGAIQVVQGPLRLPGTAAVVLQREPVAASTPHGPLLRYVLERHLDRGATLRAVDLKVEVHVLLSQQLVWLVGAPPAAIRRLATATDTPQISSVPRG